jgi:hypothetical protein
MSAMLDRERADHEMDWLARAMRWRGLRRRQARLSAGTQARASCVHSRRCAAARQRVAQAARSRRGAPQALRARAAGTRLRHGHAPCHRRRSRLNAEMTMEEVKMVRVRANGALAGTTWFAGWLFTIGFAKLIWWQALLALVAWPYFLALAVR